MIKAAALYIVIIISLIIAVITASLLTIAFYYRIENQKKDRYDRLNSSLQSGTAILLSDGFTVFDKDQAIDLYGDEKDSVILNKTNWGAFELATVKAFEQKDTLKNSFLTGLSFTDPSAIYLADEDRPLSVSGDTRITGDGELPKSGLKQSYVDGKAYTGGEELIKGTIKNSTRVLPPLNEKLINALLDQFNPLNTSVLPQTDSVSNSFYNQPVIYKLEKGEDHISGLKLKGKIILVSDSALTLDAGVIFEDVLVFAPSIIVADGFKGSCQLFAKDSISIGKNCNFLYPSFAGVFKSEESKIQSRISIGEGSHFSGILMSYEKTRSDLQTLISLGKDCLINGEVYAAGYIKLEKPVKVYGKVYARRFMMQTPSTLYENYLIDVTLNRKLLSKYYLSSMLFNLKTGQQILKWLN